jgi:hypothetical protein
MGNPIPRDDHFLERINRHPELRDRVSSILDVVENTRGDLIQADAAEKRTIEVLRQLGSEVLHDWATQGIQDASEQLRREEESIERNGKKN